MFSATADLYDLVYSFKDYRAEADKIRALIARERPDARNILDVACGTGEHARFLAADFAVDGIDVEPRFIELAKTKLPGRDFRVADMRSFELPSKYEVVQCLFSSIGYLLTPKEVVAAFTCFRRHLALGGIILIEPWLSPEGYEAGHLNMVVVDRPEVKICRMNVSQREGDVSVLRFHYLVATKEGVQQIEETHRLALFSTATLMGFLREAGLETTFDPVGLFGRGLFVAREAQASGGS